MRTFQRYLRHNIVLDKIDKYVRLVLKTFDTDDNGEVVYEDQIKPRFVKILILTVF